MATKGVIVAAGYGSRLLPVTRCVPKEMLPLLDRPAIDWVVEEFLEAGITDVLVIGSRRKRAIEDWFDRDPELEAVFGREGRPDKLAAIRPPNLKVSFLRQQEMRGAGHALTLAATFAGEDPVVVAYPDDLFGPPNVTAALIAAHRATGRSILAAQELEDEEALSRYGVLEVSEVPLESREAVVGIRRIVEKPPRGTAPSNLVSYGRYLFTPDFFEQLERDWKRHGEGEFTHQEALSWMGAQGRLAAALVGSTRYDTGTTAAWLHTNIALALDHPEYGPGLRAFLAGRL